MCVVIFRLGPEKQRQEEFQTVLAAWNYSARYKFWDKDGKYNAPGSGWLPQIAYKSRWVRLLDICYSWANPMSILSKNVFSGLKMY